MNKPETKKKLTASIAAVIFLTLGLCVTTFALTYSIVNVDDNVFLTGKIKVNLNDGRPVIEENEFLFEPGMTVEKDFFFENQGTWDVYYKLYFDNVEGGLADVLDISIRSGSTVLYSGKAEALTREKIGAAEDILGPNERRNLTIAFHYPEEAGNSGQNQSLSFDLKADAVQTKNNPSRVFE